MAKDKKKRNARKNRHIGKWPWIAIGTYIISWMALLWIGEMPWYLLVVKGILCLPALVCIWRDDGLFPTRSRLWATFAMVAVYATFWFATHPVGLLVQMLLMFTLTGVCVVLCRHPDNLMGSIVCCFEAVQLFFLLMAMTERYTFTSADLPFWQVSLGVAVPVAGLLTWLVFSKKKAKFGPVLGAFALFCFLVALVVGICISHLNFVLDTTPPVTRTVTVEDKQVDDNRKSADDYELKFTLDGRVYWVEVSFDEYMAYDIGDTLTLEEHQGAFDEAFIRVKK